MKNPRKAFCRGSLPESWKNWKKIPGLPPTTLGGENQNMFFPFFAPSFREKRARAPKIVQSKDLRVLLFYKEKNYDSMLELMVINPREPLDLKWCSIKEIGFSTPRPLKKDLELHKFYEISCMKFSNDKIKKIMIF